MTVDAKKAIWDQTDRNTDSISTPDSGYHQVNLICVVFFTADWGAVNLKLL